MGDLIFDLGFVICDLASARGGNSGGNHDSGQLTRLLPQLLHLLRKQDSPVHNQFRPV
jgi:hypothetical protein